jgi:hypothetical protein
VSLDLESTEGRRKLEWPEEVVGFLELGSACDDLVDEIFNAVESALFELSSNDAVITQWKSSSVDLSVTPLVNELGNHRFGWVPICDEWLAHLEHVPCGLVQLDKDSVVQLSQSQELQDLLWLGGKLSDTI